MKAIPILTICILVLLVLYFSWLPNSNIGSQPYFPRIIGDWVNKNWNIRTSIPFILFGILLEMTFSHPSKLKRFLILGFSLALVSVAEIGQVFIVNRHFDIKDIFWGVAGSLIGIIVGSLIKKG